ncbi:phospholipase D-like domain-containing protein [Dactylosporangium cerinum]|uniref:Phospholipase D-like domain-containing protein n=1 Tax=Dactylosporangium cerinum TaxID=1434730 RepID=A0ABV9VTY1_9ACTN
MTGAPIGSKLTVYVPCDVATVRVRLGYQETLTPIEQVVLRAVDAGADTLGGLCDALGLSRRLTLDLVQDLWRTGYLRLVKSYSGLEVTAKIREHLAAGTLERLESAETFVDDRQVMIDRLTGHVMPILGTGAPVQPKLAVPLEDSPVRIADAPIAAVLDAVERGLAREEQERFGDRPEPGTVRDGRRRRVLGAYVTDQQVSVSNRRWLALDIQTAIDPDTDQLAVSVVDGGLPDSHRAEAARRLTDLVARQPKDPFVQTLRGYATPGLLSAPTIERAVARLADQAATAAAIPAGQRRNRHRELSANYRQLSGLIGMRVEREVHARVVVGADHVGELVRLIGAARSQLVLSSPWLRYGALAAVTPALRDALKRGVQVVVLWGIGYQDKLDADVAGLLYDTTLRTSARVVASLDGGGTPAADAGPRPGPRRPWFLVPETSSRTHAKFAVADDRVALVTSWNLLNQDRPRHEVGLYVTAPPAAEAPGCHPIREILRWARTAVPGYEMSRLMLVGEHEFALREPNRPPVAPDWPPQLPEVPTAPNEGIDEHAEQAARHWGESWRYVAGAIGARLAEREHPPAEVVLDGVHRTLLWTALREARRRLVIASDKLSRQVVDERFIDALDRAVERGVAVTIVYDRPHERERTMSADGAALSNAPTEAERGLAVLVERHGAGLRVLRTGNHAKVLVWDDEAVVSSFNFLSFEGAYSSMAAHRQQSELGLRLTGQPVADDVARAVGADVSPVRVAAPVAAARQVDDSFAVAQLVLNDVSAGTDIARAVTEHLAGPGIDPWRVLDRLAENAGRDLLRVASAYCVSAHADTMSRFRRERWLRWLFEDLWMDGLYVEAALLRAAIEDDEARPGPAMTRLAAARAVALYGDVVAEVWDEVVDGAPAAEDEDVVTPTRPAAECAAVLATAMERIVFHGDQEAATMLELGMYTLGPGWQPLAAAVRTYADRSYHRPVPLGLIRSNLDRHHDLADQAALWKHISDGLDRVEQTQLQNSHSVRVLHELVNGKDSAFADVRGCGKERDLRRLALQVAPGLPAHDQLGPLIDEVSRAIDDSKPPVHGEHRKRLLRQLTAIVSDVRALAATYDPDMDAELAGDPDKAELLDRARDLAAVVAAELPDLIVAVDAATNPENRFVRDVLDSFAVLQDWAALGAEPAAA